MLLLAYAHYDLMTSPDTTPALPPPFTMAAADWLPLWRLPLLLPILTSCFLSASAETTPFPRDLEPISIVGLNGESVLLIVHTDVLMVGLYMHVSADVLFLCSCSVPDVFLTCPWRVLGMLLSCLCCVPDMLLACS